MERDGFWAVLKRLVKIGEKHDLDFRMLKDEEVKQFRWMLQELEKHHKDLT